MPFGAGSRQELSKRLGIQAGNTMAEVHSPRSPETWVGSTDRAEKRRVFTIRIQPRYFICQKGKGGRLSLFSSEPYSKTASGLLKMAYFAIACLLVCAAGISTHLNIFIKGDWDRHAEALFYVFFAPLLLSLSLPVFFFSSTSFNLRLALLLLSFDSGLCLSIFTYRYFFHPLRHFPGPRTARLSSIWSVRDAVLRSQWQLQVHQLHQDYGDFVRIKPNEISINDPGVIKDIYGISTKCTKGPFYDMNYPHKSLQMTRSKAFHSKRRRLWDRAFTSQALAGYEPHILRHCQTFLEIVRLREGRPLEVTNLVTSFAWDSMGILVSGKSFNMLRGTSHTMLNQLKEYAPIACLLLWAPWPIILARNLPVIKSRTTKLIEWYTHYISERKKADLSHDLFSYLIRDFHSSSSHDGKATDQDLVFDTELAVIAGSDTTACALSSALFFLAKHPKTFQKLREEIEASVDPGELLYHSVLMGKPYLDGCINESLRLCPPTPSGLPRETGPDGLTIAGTHIPPRTTVSVPTYTTHRDPRNFREPEKFVPERWFSIPEMVIRKEAFIPFSRGPYSCVGKPFAMMELRLLLATIVREFDLEFPSGEEPLSIDTLGGTGPLDCFITRVPCYRLVFKERVKK
ncbi:cytochrome P450 [Aspergillus lucknowensis]|uniref:Cytochrome P450 n=1 Tax=Aspergillus lucknowensis TaxID=176173 RepID=A0ABR4M273_9EURO